MSSKRLTATLAELKGVETSMVAIEDGCVRSDNTARDLTDEEKAQLTDLEARHGELLRSCQELWEREERNQRVAELTRNALPQAQGPAAEMDPVTAGEYIATYCRAFAFGSHDPEAMGQLATLHRASDLTSDLAGLLPVDIVAPLIKFVDANRYAVNAARSMPMPLKGKTFGRPRATQRSLAGQQTEGSALTSQKMTIVQDTVTKTAQGGFVTVTEQDIDWTDPAFWQILIEDLAESYAIQTSTVLTAAIVSAATNKVTGYTPASSAFTVFHAKLVAAAGTVFTNAKKLPDTLFAAPDVWQAIVGYLDGNNRPMFGLNPQNAEGPTMTVDNFQGQPLGLRLVVDPNFAATTCVVANSSLVEYYEINKGLNQIAAPSTMSVDVAYRGYFATNVYAQGLCSMQTA
jgi:hypothetical protein